MFLKLKALQPLFVLLFFGVAQAKTLKVAMSSPPNSFDWTSRSSLVDASIITNIQEGLYRYQGSEVVPAVSEPVMRSKDFKEYTFKIRKDAKWSDGRPVFAQDFVNGWLKLLSPQSTSNYLFYLFDIVNAEEFREGKVQESEVGIKAVDDKTLWVKLKKPKPNWEVITAFWPTFPIRKDLIEKHGNNWSRPGVMVSTGPFVLDTFESGTKIVLLKNKFYPKASGVEQVEILYSSDFEKLYKEFESKKIDILLEIPYTHLQKIKSSRLVQSAKLMQLIYLGLNTDKFPMNSEKFRQGLLLSLNQDGLAPKNSNLKPIKNLIAKPAPGSDVEIVQKQDLKKAKALIGSSAVVVSPKLKLQILTFSREPYWSVAKIIQEQWSKNLGLNVEISALDPAELVTAASLGTYSAILQGWTAKIKAEEDFLVPFTSRNKQNYIKLADPYFDQLLESASGQAGKKRSQILNSAQKYLVQEKAMYMPVFYISDQYLVQSHVVGFTEDHMGNLKLRDVSFK